MNVCVVPSAAPEVAEATEGVVVSVNCRGAFAIHTFGFFVQIRRVSQLPKILSTQQEHGFQPDLTKIEFKITPLGNCKEYTWEYG